MGEDSERKTIASIAERHYEFARSLNILLSPILLPLGIILRLLGRKKDIFSQTDPLKLIDEKEKAIESPYITKFVNKYGEDCIHFDKNSTQFQNLKMLLKSKGVKEDIVWEEELARCIYLEVVRQNYKDFKRKILELKPKKIDDYIDSFIQYCGDNTAEKLPLLEKLLEEKNLDTSNLIDKVEGASSLMRLQHFEKSLAEGPSISLKDIDHMSGYEFEAFLEKLFKKMGYRVETTKLTGDQGADLVVEKLGERIAVQAKNHVRKVSNSAIQEAVASVKHYECDAGMVVANSLFTKSAVELAKSNKIKLIDKPELGKLIEKYF